MYNEQANTLSQESLKHLAAKRRERKLASKADLRTKSEKNKAKYDRTKDRRANKVREW